MMQTGQQGSTLRLVDQLLVVIGCTLLVALFGTVLLGIVTRAFNQPLTWTDEAARFLMVWLSCAGWIIAGRRRAHVRISFFLDRLPRSFRRAISLLMQVGLMVLGAVIGGFGVLLVQRNLDMEANSLPISAAWLYAPIVPAGVALVLQSVIQFWELLRLHPAIVSQPPRGVLPQGKILE